MPVIQPVLALVARGLAALVSALPRSARDFLARATGRFAYGVGIRRRVTLENLRAAFPALPEPELERVARGAYVNMARAAFEALGSTRLSAEELERSVVTENWAPIDSALKAGKGLLVATAHFGSWELFGNVMAQRGIKVNAVVRNLRGAFNAQIIDRRRQSGLGLIPTRGAISGSVKALRRGEAVAMLIDQVLPAEKGVFVPFFGRPACTTPALTAAARRSGAPVFVVMAAREGDGLRMFVEGPFPVPDTGDRRADLEAHTAQVTAAIEKYVRRYPDQWLWLHRRWKVQPPPS